MKKINFKKGSVLSMSKGFTLIELLVVVGIIGILAAVVLAALNTSRTKGNDAAVKSNLRNAISQGEILYNTRTANKDTYINACTNGVVDGVQGVGGLVSAAAKASGLSFVPDTAGSISTATCNDGIAGNSGLGWAAEVPLKSAGANQMWCVDNTGKSKQTTGTSLSANNDITCQ